MTLKDIGRREKIQKECYDRLKEIIGEYDELDISDDDIRQMAGDILEKDRRSEMGKYITLELTPEEAEELLDSLRDMADSQGNMHVGTLSDTEHFWVEIVDPGEEE